MSKGRVFMSEFLKDGHKPLQLQMTALIRIEKSQPLPLLPNAENVSNTESSSTGPRRLLITREARNALAFEINELLRIRREHRGKRSNFAEESAHGVAEKGRARQRVKDSFSLPLGVNQLRSTQDRELPGNHRLRDAQHHLQISNA